MVVIYSKSAQNIGFINYSTNSFDTRPDNRSDSRPRVTYHNATETYAPIILKVQYPVPSGRASIVHFRLHADGFPDGIKRYLAPGMGSEPLIWTTKFPEPWSLDKGQVLSYGTPQYLGYYRKGVWQKHLRSPLYFYSLDEFSQTYPDCPLPLCRPSDIETTPVSRNERMVNILKNGIRQTRRLSSMTWMIILGIGIFILLLIGFLFFIRSPFSLKSNPVNTQNKEPGPTTEAKIGSPKPEPLPSNPGSPKSGKLPLISQQAINTSTSIQTTSTSPPSSTSTAPSVPLPSRQKRK